MENTASPSQFSNLQLELLKLYSRNIPDEDLFAIKDFIARYMAEKASRKASEIMKQKNITVEDILQSHIRTPYRK